MSWIPVPKFPGYSVNNLGQVRNDHTERILRPQFTGAGVPYIGMMRNGEHLNRGLALLVMQSWRPMTNEYFDTPINMDWDRANCELDNLMWRPRWFAIRYHQQAKEPYQNRINAPVRPVDDEEVWNSSLEASQAYGLLERDVVMSILNRTYAWPTYQMFETVENVLAY